MEMNYAELAEEQRTAHSNWMQNYKRELRRKSWRELAKGNPTIRIANGYVWANCAYGWRIVDRY